MKDLPVLYEDPELIAINKNAGIAVQGGHGIKTCVLDILERQAGGKVYPVHRLDRDTAGILLVARSAQAARALTDRITTGALVKKYQAVCFGRPCVPSGSIREKAGRAGDRKPAQTLYRTLSSSDGLSLLELEIKTGRMHQIRIHLAGLGNPIVADDKYGDFPRNKEARSRWHVRKLQLAAVYLVLEWQGRPLELSVPLPDHMVALVTAAGLNPPG